MITYAADILRRNVNSNTPWTQYCLITLLLNFIVTVTEKPHFTAIIPKVELH